MGVVAMGGKPSPLEGKERRGKINPTYICSLNNQGQFQSIRETWGSVQGADNRLMGSGSKIHEAQANNV